MRTFQAEKGANASEATKHKCLCNSLLMLTTLESPSVISIVFSMRIPLRSIFYFLLQGSLLDICSYMVFCHLKITLSRFIPVFVAKVLK